MISLKKVIFSCSIVAVMSLFFSCQKKDNGVVNKWKIFMEQYAAQLDALNIDPTLHFSYLDNLSTLYSSEELIKQEKFFQLSQSQLEDIPRHELTKKWQAYFDLLTLDIQLHLERIELERVFQNLHPSLPLSQESIYFVPNGKRWYSYFLKRWLQTDISPQEVEAKGKIWIAAAKNQLRALRTELGFTKDTLAFYEHLEDAIFKENRAYQIKALFKTRGEILEEYMPSLFYDTAVNVPTIEKTTDTLYENLPAYYQPEEEVLYFNEKDRPFNKRFVDFLYLHLAIPGHHYLNKVEEQYIDSLPAFVNRLPLHVFEEGWASYVESLGKELGLFRTLYDEIGWHEWNLIRSVRVVMDVGINFSGWSDEKALRFWQEHIFNKDEIGKREIKRIKEWPCQVLTYKFGAERIQQAKAKAEQAANFDIRDFHQNLLKDRGLVIE